MYCEMFGVGVAFIEMIFVRGGLHFYSLFYDLCSYFMLDLETYSTQRWRPMA